MQILDGQRLYSASDLVNYLECEVLTALDLRALEDAAMRAERCEADASSRLLAERGDRHERDHLGRLRDGGRQVIDVAEGSPTLAQRVDRTLQAMRDGAEVIYQATLRDAALVGHADFLYRVDGGAPSVFGAWHYEVADTKLARSAKAKFAVQLAFYSELLRRAQGVTPQRMWVELGNGEQHAWRVADFSHYFDALLARFLRHIGQAGDTPVEALDAMPVEHCSLCHWRDRCERMRLAQDHLSQVAGISRVQIGRLREAGVRTMAALAGQNPLPDVRIGAETLGRLREQARLQDAARGDGERRLSLLPLEESRGFARLPAPDDGDLYFDMEGDPLEDGGLEYLFGFWLREGGRWTFRAFWAHDRAQERLAFEQVVDFIVERRRRHPGMHVYHYASYELSALRRLASGHATRETEVDDLQRQGVLVDLYQVVREAIRTSEPGYSIKNIERFYRPAREGDVKDAGASIVWYERWRQTGEQALLDDIAAYNRDDVESTQQLHDWLLDLRPAELAWRSRPGAVDDDQPAEDTRSDRVRQIEARLAQYRERMVDPLPADRSTWSAREHALELVYQLLDFHRRGDKPGWWEMFDRMDRSEDEWIDDPECLGGLELDPENPPTPVARSFLYTYVVPEQDSKLTVGSKVRRCDTAEKLGKIESFDETTRRLQLKRGVKRDPLPPRLSLGPEGPLDTKSISAAIYRLADSLLAQDGRCPALLDFLARRHPRMHGRAPGAPLVDSAGDPVGESVACALALDGSYVYVQGPPGAGKTYTGARMIAALLAAGHTVGVMSNSHKAINHLMTSALRVALAERTPVIAVKKAASGRPETEIDDIDLPVENRYTNDDAWAANPTLIGGTAWCFAGADQALDYLFVDEAGQVALANLVAAGTAARNIVLLGDQMQLGQPIQGVHPGRSGESALEYLLDGAATIAPDKGIFLATTWRMHPDVCRFISDAVYDGRLLPQAANVRRTLVLAPDAHPLLQRAGIVHAPIEHQGCSQGSLEEAELVRAIYDSALAQRYMDKEGRPLAMSPENILVVAPYNVQVNLLKRTLPASARVGTMDKFQGQEAELVIVSMTTSSEQDLPRHIEFLYSRNRLNVAISRARCLAIVIANPALMAIKCKTPEQMALVNMLCGVAKYSPDLRPEH